ncbi:MAG: glycosyltransferase family 9 protein [Betaproteobacteria bacterium]|jgi:ADP-heptose:LPS heptosyltransferase
MWRNGIELLSDTQFNMVFNHGALGDVICSLPAAVHARRTHGDALTIRLWVPPWQMELIDHLMKPYGKFEIRDFTDFPMKKVEREGWGMGPVAINQMPFNTHTRNRVHMVDYAFGCLLDARPENMAERSYPTKAPLGKSPVHAPYVVFPVGATSENKLFKAHVMGPVIEWALDNDCTPVLVGTKTSHTHTQIGDDVSTKPIDIIDEVDKLPKALFDECVDLREKTTLLGLRDVLGHADAVVGVDGGTLHLAGTTDTCIIYALGTTLPKHRYIARRGNPNHKIRYVGPRDLECAGCQSNMTLMFHHDFRHCVYKDSLCMDKLHPEDFINGLKELFKEYPHAE